MADSPAADDLDDDDVPNLRRTGAGAPLQPAASRKDLERLYTESFSKLRGYFRRSGLHDALANDLAQETFVQALRHLAQFDGRAKLSTWVWAIARNQLLGHLRQRSQRPPDAETLFEVVDPDSLTTGEPEHLKAQRECVRRGFAAFSQDHPDRAQVLYLAVVEGWTREELAQFLGRTPHAATEYLSQCRAKLRPYIVGCQDGD